MNKLIGKITKITGSKVLVTVSNKTLIEKVNINNQLLNYVSIGSLIGTKLINDRTLILTVEEILDNEEILITCTICGIYDEVNGSFNFGTNSYPVINEKVFLLNSNILDKIFNKNNSCNYIGTYVYDKEIKVSYNPDVIFGKHLGVFGNTGSGKTCTVVSLIQNYIRNNENKNIKFVILDVNGEYEKAFKKDEAKYISFSDLRINHSILNNTEYGKLFRASEGVQYPVLKSSIEKLKAENENWDLKDLNGELDKWIDSNTPNNNYGKPDTYTNNNLNGYLRTLFLRLDQICEDDELMRVINNYDSKNVIDIIKESKEKVIIIDLQVSTDTLDIILFLLFKALYIEKILKKSLIKTHLSLVLEEAHRYINSTIQETKLGSYYIDKLAREGRKYGIGLIISSQVPSMLSYEIVSQCNSVVMHKITSKKDLEFLRGVMRISNDSFYLQMSSLEKQHAIVCGEAFSNDSLVKIRTADPLPNSNDPTIYDNNQKNDNKN